MLNLSSAEIVTTGIIDLWFVEMLNEMYKNVKLFLQIDEIVTTVMIWCLEMLIIWQYTHNLSSTANIK